MLVSTDKAVDHFYLQNSEAGAMIDALFAFTQPGEFVFSYSGKINFNNSYGRKVELNENTKLIVVQDGGGLVLPDLGQLQKKYPKAVILVFRNGVDSRASYLAGNSPNVVEILAFRHDELDSINSISIVAGDPELIEQMRTMSSQRGAWVGKTDQRSLQDYIERSTQDRNSLIPTRVLNYSAQNGRSLVAKGESQRGQLVSDFIALFPGFKDRDNDSSFALGLGQPEIAIDSRFLNPFLLSSSPQSYQQTHGKLFKQLGKWYQDRYNVLLPKYFVVSDGVSGAILDILSSLPKETVVGIPEDVYPLYQNVSQLLGLKVKRVLNSPATGKIDLETEDNIKGIGILLVNFPKNPNGNLLDPVTRARLHSIAKKGVLVVNDLSYPRFTYSDQPVSSLLSGTGKGEDGFKNMIEIFSASKDFGLAEARIAAIVGDPEVISKIQSYSTPTRVKVGLFAAILENESQAFLTDNVEMRKRRDYIVEAFDALGWPKDKVVVPEGGENLMLMLPDGVKSSEVAKELWQHFQIMTMPGEFFSPTSTRKQDFLRVSLSLPSERLKKLKEHILNQNVRYPSLVVQKSFEVIQVMNDVTGGTIEVIRSRHSEIENMHPYMRNAFQLAFEQYAIDHSSRSEKFIRQEQALIDPEKAVYFFTKDKNGHLTGMVMSISGKEYQLPIERKFPEVDFRNAVYPSKNIDELARLAANSGIGNLRRMLKRNYEYYLKKYGSVEKIPDDLKVVAWTIVPRLYVLYELMGFKPINDLKLSNPRARAFYIDKATLLKRAGVN